MIIRDQAGNPMSTGVRLREEVIPADPAAAAMQVDQSRDLLQPDKNGIIPDTLGAINRKPGTVPYLRQTKIDATFKQTLTVYGSFGLEYRTALILEVKHRLTNSGVTVTKGTVEKRARPTK